MSAIPLQGTPDWYEWRRSGIGASEIPAILGEDPWTGEYELALEKRGEKEREPENDAQRWGKRVQRTALEMYAETTDGVIRHVNTTGLSRRYPHVFASLDGRYVGKRVGVEVKLSRERWDDEPPRRVAIQCQVQMGVLDLDAVEVLKVSMGYSAPQVFTIERDDLAATRLMRLGEAWYLRYALGDELPPVDGSRAASRRLDRIEGMPEMQADPDQIALALKLHGIRKAQKDAEVAEREVANRLKDSMHGSYVLVGSGVKVTWKPTKPRTTVAWEPIASVYARTVDNLVRELRQHEPELALEGVDVSDDQGLARLHETVRTIYTTTGEGTRPIRVTLSEEDHD